MTDNVPLRQALILFKDKPAGLLSETQEGGSRFSYDDGWHEAIACALPATQRVYDWRFGLHPFFQHLGAEGWLREQQARSDQLDARDDLGLLLRHGADCIGAVSVQPTHHITGPTITPAGDTLAAAAVQSQRTLSGVQRKLLVQQAKDGRYRPAGNTGPAPFIAKLNSQHHADLVRNEFISLRYAAALLGKGEVTQFERRAVLYGSTGEGREEALIVTRFDRLPDGGKLRLEDCAQILAKPSGLDFTGKYDAGYEDVAEVIRQHSARPEIDLDKFFRLLLVNAIIGNGDAHLKNFSLLECREGLRLAPAYDLLNTLLYAEYQSDFGLRLDGRRHRLEALNRRILSDFGAAIGLASRAVTLAFQQLEQRARRAESLVAPAASEPPDGFLHRYQEILRNGCHRIFTP